MTKPLHVIVDPVMFKSLDPYEIATFTSRVRAHGAKLTLLEPSRNFATRRKTFAELAQLFEADETRPLIFAPIGTDLLLAGLPRLQSAFILNPGPLEVAMWSQLLAEDDLLNPNGIFLPFGMLTRRRDLLKQLFGERVFFRPNSSLKPFAGQAIEIDELGPLVKAIVSHENPSPSTLCFICEAKEIAAEECRFWMVEGQPVAAASYAHAGSGLGAPAPDHPGWDLARRVGDAMILHEDCYTLDIMITEDGPKVVELNGMSTSGFYGGLDPAPLLKALDRVIV